MHLTLKQLITLLILVGVPTTAGTVLYSVIVSPDNWVFLGGSPISPRDYKDGGAHGVYGAPGPVAGVGLPVLAVGCGLYWLIRRRRKSG
jgi:hypothetical protein